MVKRIKKTTSAGPLSSRKIAALKRGFARHNASRHLYAYLFDHNPRHIAAGWLAYRKSNLPPDRRMLAWMDRLAEHVVNPSAAKFRPRENTVRDLEIWRNVRTLQRSTEPTNAQGSIWATVGRSRGLSVGAVKMIVSRVEKSLRDPYYTPRAFRKS